MSVRLTSHAAAAAACVAAVAAFAFSPAASAAERAQPSIRVPYADLDLTSDRGITELYARVRRAARQVCRTQITGSRVDERYPTCMRDTVARAVSQLGVAALAELHSELAAPDVRRGVECAVAPAHRRIII